MQRLVVKTGLAPAGLAPTRLAPTRLALAGLALAGLTLTGCAQQPPTGSSGTQSPTTAPVSATSPPVPPTELSPPTGLSPQGKDVLQQAKRDGTRTIGLTVSTEPGQADEVAAAVDRLGGTVEATDATTGYVRVTAPVELAEEIASVDGISRVDVDEPLSNSDPTP
ncbi:hypothetical protein ACQPYE_35685 [Actinosynnema sp. CA-299493]